MTPEGVQAPNPSPHRSGDFPPLVIAWVLNDLDSSVKKRVIHLLPLTHPCRVVAPLSVCPTPRTLFRLPTLRLACIRPNQKRKKPRNHTAATGKAVHSVALSFKRVFFSHHPSPVHLPSGRKNNQKNSFSFLIFFFLSFTVTQLLQ